MPNDITVTKITTSGSEKWDVAYTTDAVYPAGSPLIKTLNTAGTLLDRNIQIAITTPAGSATVAGGDLSVESNYTETPAVSIALDSQTTSGITINDTQPSSGYYLKLIGSSSALNGTTQVSRAPITLARTAGWVTAQSATNVLNSTDSRPTVTVNSGSKTRYLAIPTATFTTSGATVYCSGAGWVPAGSASSGIGTVSAGTITNNTALPSGSTSSGSLNYQKYIKIGAGYYPSDLYYYNGVGAINGSIGGSSSNGSATAVLTNTNNINTIVDISGKTAGTDYWAIKATATTSAGSYTPKYTVTTPGYLGSTVTGAAQTVLVTADSIGTSIYIPKATYSTSAGVTTITTAGYLPANTKVTNITTQTPTTNYANSGLDDYFNAGSSSDYDVSITPRYSNSAGYVAAHSNTNNGGVGYWKIKTTSVVQGATSVSGTTATLGTATWGTGWISAGSIGAATLSNTASTSVTYKDITDTTSAPMLTSGGYLYINKGYTDNVMISLAKLIPDWPSGTSVAAAGHILSGYKAYDQDGGVLAGSIQTKTASDLTVSGRTVTVPAGYYATQVTKSIGVGTVTSGTATISSATYTYDSTNTRFNVTGSANVSAPTVNTAGYISSSEGTRNAKSGGATLSTTVPRIAIAASMSGTAKVTPAISKIETASGNDATNITAQVSAATTTLPTSGYYVAVQSAASANNITATPSVSTAGYGTTTAGQYSATTATLNVGANASSVTYLPIAAGACTIAGGGLSITTNYSGTPTITMATGSSTNMANITVGAQDTSNYPYYFKVNASTAALSGKTKATRAAVTDAHTAGYIPAKNATTVISSTAVEPTVTVNAASNTTYVSLKKATMTVAGTNTVSPTASVAGNANVTLGTTDNGIAVTATGGGTASVAATATTNAAGYAPASTQLGSATLSAASKTTTATKYISGVTLVPPSSGTRSFTIQVPNGSISDFISFVFTTDESGNVTVAGPD